MITAIDDIGYPKGGTKTANGLNKVRTVIFTEEHGMRPASAGVGKVLVVITDGQSNSGFEVRLDGSGPGFGAPGRSSAVRAGYSHRNRPPHAQRQASVVSHVHPPCRPRRLVDDSPQRKPDFFTTKA